MTWSELEPAIVAGDASGCQALLAKLTEPERRALAADAMQAYRQAHRERDPRSAVWQARQGAAFIAMLGTATLPEIKKEPPTWRDGGVYDVLATRRPVWLGDWCEWVLNEHTWAWSVVRRMVREGLWQRPASGMYYLRMLEACGFTPPKQFLLDDPGLLEFEIWELFRVEGNSQLSLSGIEKYGHKGIW